MSLISVDEALGLIKANLPERDSILVELTKANGRYLAEDLIAQRTQPPTHVSAMDGYAVRLADVAQPGARLTVIGEAPAGKPFNGAISEGETVRIFTGGSLPNGANHIVIQEDVDRDDNMAICRDAYTEARHIRAAGIDFLEGDVLAKRGERVTAPILAIAAASNHSALPVFKNIRVAIIASGDELKPPGSDLQLGEIINSNPAGLSPLIRAWGGDPIEIGIAKDDPESISQMIESARDMDVVLTVGGASVGDHDHMRSTFAREGYERIFEKVAVRPGKPTWFSRKGHQSVLGLPGNPASALVCAHLFLNPLLTGITQHTYYVARTKASLGLNAGRTHYMRATATFDSAGQLWVEPATSQDSSRLRPFLTSNALIVRAPHEPAASEGSPVRILKIGDH